MKKLNNKISIAGIFLFCTIIVGFVFVQTPLNLGYVPDGGDPPPPSNITITNGLDAITINAGETREISVTASGGIDYGRVSFFYIDGDIKDQTIGWDDDVPITYQFTAPDVPVNQQQDFEMKIKVVNYYGSESDTAIATVNGPDDPDRDGDGLSNDDETIIGTDPDDDDSDNDGLLDGYEWFTSLTDPNNDDSDNDGLLDGYEWYTSLTDPNDEDTDGDNLYDGEEDINFDTDPNIYDPGCFRYDDPDDSIDGSVPFCGVAFVAWEKDYNYWDVFYNGDLPPLNSSSYNYVDLLEESGYYVIELENFINAEYFEHFLKALILADYYNTRLFVITLMHGSVVFGSSWIVPNSIEGENNDIFENDFEEHITSQNMINKAPIYYPDLQGMSYKVEGKVEELIFYAAPCYAMTSPYGCGHNIGEEVLPGVSKTGVIFGVAGEQGNTVDLERFLHNFIINDFSLKESYDHSHDNENDVRYIDWGTDYNYNKPFYSIKKIDPENDGYLDRHEGEYEIKLELWGQFVNEDLNQAVELGLEITAYREKPDINDPSTYNFTRYNYQSDYILNNINCGPTIHNNNDVYKLDDSKTIYFMEYCHIENPTTVTFTFKVYFYSNGTNPLVIYDTSDKTNWEWDVYRYEFDISPI